MSKFRYINTKFWDDPYIIDLDPIEKLMYIYFITNPLTNICGIYEITIKRIGFDTGIDRDMVAKILARFEKDDKMYYRNGWIAVRNFIKNQRQSDKVGDNINVGIQRNLESVPEEMKNLALNGLQTLEAPYKPLEILELKPELELKSKPKLINSKEIAKIFEELYKEYPKKLGKDDAYRHFEKQYRESKDKELLTANIKKAIDNYKAYIIKHKTDYDYIKYASGFFNKLWKDFVDVQPTKIVDKSSEVMVKVAEKVHEEKERLRKLHDDPEYHKRGLEAFSKIKKLGGAK